MNSTNEQISLSPRGELGQGVYSLAELRVFLTFHAGPEAGDRVPAWLKQALNPVGHKLKRPDYSFADLVSLLVVSELIDHGIPMHRIRESELDLRLRTKADRPFTHRNLTTDGIHIFIDGGHPGQLEETGKRASGQQVQAAVISDFLKRVEYSGDWASRWLPLGSVALDPKRQFGEPTIQGTRVLSKDVSEAALTGSVRSAAESYGVPDEAVRDALEFERAITAAT